MIRRMTNSVVVVDDDANMLHLCVYGTYCSQLSNMFKRHMPNHGGARVQEVSSGVQNWCVWKDVSELFPPLPPSNDDTRRKMSTLAICNSRERMLVGRHSRKAAIGVRCRLPTRFGVWQCCAVLSRACLGASSLALVSSVHVVLLLGARGSSAPYPPPGPSPLCVS